MFLEFQLSALCQESGLPQIFQSREATMYPIRLSQCKIQWSYQVLYSWDNLYHIKCALLYLKVSSSKTGEHLSTGLWCHTCSIDDHVISKYNSPASDCYFLAGYLHKCFDIFEMIQNLNLFALMKRCFKRTLDVPNKMLDNLQNLIKSSRLPKCTPELAKVGSSYIVSFRFELQNMDVISQISKNSFCSWIFQYLQFSCYTWIYFGAFLPTCMLFMA